MSRWENARRHAALGPALWPRVDAAEAKASLEHTPWDQGVASAAAAFDQPRSFAGLFQAAVGGVTGYSVGVVGLSEFPVIVQLVVVAVVSMTAYWAVPTLWASVVALDAPPRQRDEARRALLSERERNQIAEETLRGGQEDLRADLAKAEERLSRSRDLARAWGELAIAVERGNQLRAPYQNESPPVPGSWAGSAEIYTQYALWRSGIENSLAFAGLADAAIEFGPRRAPAPEEFYDAVSADLEQLRKLLQTSGDMFRAVFDEEERYYT